MPLKKIHALFGEAQITLAIPGIMKNHDCVYQPYSRQKFFDRDETWGIYHHDGSLVDAAAYARGPNLDLVGQSRNSVNGTEYGSTIEEECIYFGPIVPHYGHFLVTSLARAWYLSWPEAAHCKLVCHSDAPIEAHFTNSYMGPLFRALGLTADRFIVPERATRFKRLTIPCPALIEQKLAHSVFVEPMHKIGHVLLGSKRRNTHQRPIYLSKSQVPAGVVKIINEAEVDDLMRDHGVDVVFPEQISLSDQVRIFNSRSKMLGFNGSSFHTHIFSEENPHIFSLTLSNFVNSNSLIFDLINRAKADYYFPEDGLSDAHHEHFAFSRRINDPTSLVKDFLGKAEIATQKFVMGHRIRQSVSGLKRALVGKR